MAEGYIPVSRLPFTCPVCMDEMKDPRSLPCLHSLCTICLQSHIDICFQNQYGTRMNSMKSFPCPVCRTTTKPQQATRSVRSWAEQFPINHIILSLLDEVVDIEVPEAISEDLLCDEHDEFRLSLFCKDHQRLCCPMCVATKHRKCNDVIEIENIVDAIDVKSEKEQINTQLKCNKDKLSKEEERTSEEKERLGEDLVKAEEEVRSATCMAINHLRYLEENAIKDIEELHSLLIDGILVKEERNAHAQLLSDRVADVLSQNLDDVPHNEIFIKVERAKAWIRDMQTDIDKNRSRRQVPQLKFEVSEAVQRILATEKLGKAKLHNGASENGGEDIVVEQQIVQCIAVDELELDYSQSRHNVGDGNYKYAPLEDNTHLQLVGHLQEYGCNDAYVLQSGESGPRHTWFTGSVELSHGLIATCHHTKNTVQLYKDFKEIYEFKCPTAPFGLTTTLGVRFAVTFPQENLVRILELRYSENAWKLLSKPRVLGEAMVQITEIQTGCPCYGISLISPRLVIACESSVKVFSRRGCCIQKVSHSEEGLPIFTRACGVAVDDLRSMLYVSDEGSHAVIALKILDKLIIEKPEFVYTSDHLRNPQGIAVSAVGRVLVCGFGSRNVHILSCSGRCLEILNCVDRPWSVSTELPSSKMIITFYPGGGAKEEDKKISATVYRLL